MSIVPNWSIVAGFLVMGFGLGAAADHQYMQNRVDKMNAARSEELRLREVQRSKDEVAAREEERRKSVIAAQIEQDKTNEISRICSDADRLIARVRQQAASKPAGAGGVSAPAATCENALGGVVPYGSREGVVRLAQRAEEQRAALGACYQSYDALTP